MQTHVQSLRVIIVLTFCLLTVKAHALTFPIPKEGDIVGEIQTYTVRSGESLGEIGRRFDIGVYEMIEANPNMDPWVPTEGGVVVIPSQFILPKGPRTGIVVNLGEMRLYYYQPDKAEVSTHPIGIGKTGWSCPLGQTTILRKKKDPTWTPPESIRKEHLEKGDVLPPVVAAGSENPLGRYAFYLGFDEGAFLIHGSHRPGGVGVRSSHGCIRLLPEDIESLFNKVPIGTTVRIIHEPYKVGWHENHLYLEAHQPLSEPHHASSKSVSHLEKVIEAAVREKEGGHLVNWDTAQVTAKDTQGYPVQID